MGDGACFGIMKSIPFFPLPKHLRITIGALAVLTSVGQVWGRHGKSSESPSSSIFFVDVKAVGKGEACTALAAGYAALFYNPANLEDVEQMAWRMVSQGGMSLVGLGKLSDVVHNASLALESEENLGRLLNETTLFEAFSFGHAHVSVHMGAFLLWPGWGAGFLLRIPQLDTRPDPKEMSWHIRAIADASLVLGKSFSLVEDHISIGAVVRLIYRFSLDRHFSFVDLLLLAQDTPKVFRESLAEGLLVDGDVGITLKLPFLESLNPRVSLVLAHAIPGYILASFGILAADSNREMLLEARRLHVGLAVFGRWFSGIEPSIEIGLRDLGLPPNKIVKHIHVGTDWRFLLSQNLTLSLRMGWSHGRISCGASVETFGVRIDAAYYAVDVGLRGYKALDHRFVASLSF